MSNAIPEEIKKLTEMSPGDHKLLAHVLTTKQPKKILEIGVSAGGTTCYLLEHASKDAVIYSVDIAKEYYQDSSKSVGYLALDFYSSKRHPDWHLFPGQDICQCIEKIGGDIDFIVLDAAHILPGELLNFIVALPFLHSTSTLFLHDLSLHMYHKIQYPGMKEARACFCTSLLFTAIPSHEKLLSDDNIPNSGIITIERDLTIQHIYMLINMLFLDWFFLPEPRVIAETMAITRKYYNEKTADLINKAILYNLKMHGVTLK